MAAKMHAFGVKFQHDEDGAGAYTDVADVISIKPPEPEVDEAETTHLESTGAWREFIAGFIEAGEAEVGLYFHKTQFNTLNTQMTGRASRYWRIQFPMQTGEITNGSRLDWQGFVKGLAVEEIEDEAVKATLTVKASGAVTFALGA